MTDPKRSSSRVRCPLPGVVAALLILAASLAHGACTFNTNPGITFAPFDPSVATTQTAFSDISIKCTPAGTTPTWSFSSANGGASPFMKHAVQSDTIPYTVAISFQSSSGSNQTWRLTATVLGQDYQNAYVGPYSDILTATITP